MPPTRTSSVHGFSIEPARAKPVAVVNPEEGSRVVGAIIRLDGRASTTSDGSDLSYEWTFLETPLGSTVAELVDVEGDGSVVTFVPDLIGQYTIGLVVRTPYRTSDQVTAVFEATSVLLPLTLRTTPNGQILFKVVSSFWKMVERNAVFSTVWSGYMQSTANDLLRAFQVDYGKSIDTIQELLQRRWIAYAPALELDSSLCTGVFGYHQGGTQAFTESGISAAMGVIISDREVVLLDGTPTLGAVGSVLTVYTSAGSPGNTGSYTINRLNSDSSGYLISPTSPFPAPTDDCLVAAYATLVTFAGNDEVYDATLALDYTTLGVEVGDVLRIESGADAGYYTITGVGVADGLLNNRTLRLDRAPTKTGASRTYSVFNTVRIAAAKTPAAATGTVFLPASEADLTLFAAKTMTGGGTLTNAYEIVVEPRHVFEAMIGERIYITSGSSSSGRSYTITGLNTAGTGYRVGAPLAATAYPAEISYRLTSTADIADRLLILEDEAYEIVSAEYDSGTDPEDGGRGEVWIVTLGSETAPTGREGMSWRIAAAISTTEHEDLEELGVTAGDLLVLEVVREDTKFVGELPCYVLGAAGNKVAFDFGAALTEPGTPGSLSDAEILSLATDLKVPHVYEDDAGETFITLVAEEVQALVESTGFVATYGNVPISSTTVIDLDTYTVTLRVKKLVRNCRIAVDDTLVSVPSLFEYIAEPTTGTNADGEVILAGIYGDTTTLDRAPLELVENRDYSISSASSTSGSNLETTAGSAIVKIPYGDLIDRDVRVGDYIDIETGFDQGRYYVSAVLDSENVRALTAEGVPPATTATGLGYTITRKTQGNFLRFVDGMFTPSSPAPDRLWAQLSLFDNSETIEDNFGVLVGVTKEQLDEYGSSQVSYRGAVRALMFAWTGGPTVRNVTIGNHVLMGLPVTEVPGRIIDVDKAYDTANGRGRVLIEDLDASGVPTGLARSYYFSSDETSGLSDFLGLSTNPSTGEEFAVLDEVPAMTPLSRGIIVDDYLTDPLWWKSSNSTGATELEKFHTWQVRVDSSQIDSRDLPLISAFCAGVRPIYTKPKISLVLYLYDEVTVEEDLSFDGSIFFYDDPILSVESTHMVDSYNGSSLPHRVFDYGSFSTRTLFEGTDLVTSAGTGVVTSARGGFMGTLAEPPLSHAPNESVGLLPGANSAFSGDIYYRGTPLVRAGDVLFIREGLNRGRYAVVSVDSDTQLTVDELTDYPPTTRPAAEIEASTDQVFQIQREDSYLLVSGGGTVLSNAGAGADATSTIEDATGNFRWNGVAVGDILVITSLGDGIVPGTHEVLEVGVWNAGDREDLDTKLVVRGTLTVAGAFTYYVMRDGLRTNPLVEMTDLVLTAGSSSVSSALTNFNLLYLRPGDQLEILMGSYAGQFFDIIDIPTDNSVHLRNFSSIVNDPGTVARVVRPSVFESDDPRDEDWELEKLCLSDAVVNTIVEPRVIIGAPLVDLVLDIDSTDPDPANWTATVTSATDLAVLGVVAGDKLEVDVAHENSGVYEVTSVVGTSAMIEGLWREEEGPVTGTFSTDDPAWDILDDTATLSTMPLPSGLAALDGVVLPGDVLEVDGVGSFVVASAAGAVLTLTRDTGVNPLASYTGRVTRRSV